MRFEPTIPAESLGTLIFLTSHQCSMLFYIPPSPSTMLPLGEKTLSFFFNIVMGAKGGGVIQETSSLVISTVGFNKSLFVSIWGGSVYL